MRRAERLFRLVSELRSMGTARAEDLARRLEVSVSTIYRDIAHLQGSGLPIEGEAGIGYLLRPGFDLPNTAFTHDQVDALAIGLAYVERTGDPSLAAAAREVRAKLQAGMPDPETRALATAPYLSLQTKEGVDQSALRAAIRDRQIVELGYTDKSSAVSLRRIRPILIWDLPLSWMVTGWCELRNDFRTFRADRISTLTITDDHFPEDQNKNVAAFLTRDEDIAKSPLGKPSSKTYRLPDAARALTEKR